MEKTGMDHACTIVIAERFEFETNAIELIKLQRSSSNTWNIQINDAANVGIYWLKALKIKGNACPIDRRNLYRLSVSIISLASPMQPTDCNGCINKVSLPFSGWHFKRALFNNLCCLLLLFCQIIKLQNTIAKTVVENFYYLEVIPRRTGLQLVTWNLLSHQVGMVSHRVHQHTP